MGNKCMPGKKENEIRARGSSRFSKKGKTFKDPASETKA